MKKQANKTFIDISWPLANNMTAYKNNQVVSIKPIKIFEQHAVRDTLMTLGTHSGTHIDAPAHFLEHGQTIETLDFSVLIGECRVLDLSSCDDYIEPSDLQNHAPQAGERLLLKTKNSIKAATDLFDSNFVYVSADASQYLVDCGIILVGIDYLGIERNQPAHKTHDTFFKGGVVIVEGLRLAHVDAGSYQFYCLPLLCPSLEAAPARALLGII